MIKSLILIILSVPAPRIVHARWDFFYLLETFFCQMFFILYNLRDLNQSAKSQALTPKMGYFLKNGIILS